MWQIDWAPRPEFWERGEVLRFPTSEEMRAARTALVAADASWVCTSQDVEGGGYRPLTDWVSPKLPTVRAPRTFRRVTPRFELEARSLARWTVRCTVTGARVLVSASSDRSKAYGALVLDDPSYLGKAFLFEAACGYVAKELIP